MKNKTRDEVYNKFSGKCAYCGNDLTIKSMQVDHFYPQAFRDYFKMNYQIDVDSKENLMPSCRRCNHYKRADFPDQFRDKIKTLHERVSKIYISKVALDFGIVTIKPFSGKFYFEELRKENL